MAIWNRPIEMKHPVLRLEFTQHDQFRFPPPQDIKTYFVKIVVWNQPCRGGFFTGVYARVGWPPNTFTFLLSPLGCDWTNPRNVTLTRLGPLILASKRLHGPPPRFRGHHCCEWETAYFATAEAPRTATAFSGSAVLCRDRPRPRLSVFHLLLIIPLPSLPKPTKRNVSTAAASVSFFSFILVQVSLSCGQSEPSYRRVNTLDFSLKKSMCRFFTKLCLSLRMSGMTFCVYNPCLRK